MASAGEVPATVRTKADQKQAHGENVKKKGGQLVSTCSTAANAAESRTKETSL